MPAKLTESLAKSNDFAYHGLLDIGNSSYKLALTSKTGSGQVFVTSRVEELALRIKKHRLTQLWTCSVSPPRYRQLLDKKPSACQVSVVDAQSELPIRSCYEPPAALGADRVLQILAGWHRFPNRPLLVLSFGTCFTHTFLTKQGIIQGGGIAPGLHMRLKSLAQFPSLPDLSSRVTREGDVGLNTGRSTRESILVGTREGMLREAQAWCDAYGRKEKELVILATGGEWPYFEKCLKGVNLGIPNLELHGLQAFVDWRGKGLVWSIWIVKMACVCLLGGRCFGCRGHAETSLYGCIRMAFSDSHSAK